MSAATCRRRHLRMRGAGRNMTGLRVVEAICRRCGWNHMTAYRRGHKIAAVMYLRRRWQEHA